jgi:AcrR family transcriptional regulator
VPRGPTKRRPLTVARLLDAATVLFAERGYGATSIPEICSLAGLTKGAFYSNFADKEALFLALFDREGQRRLDRLREALPPSALMTRLAEDRPLAAELSVQERRWQLLSLEFSLHAMRRPAVAAALARHEAQARAALAELIVRGLESAGRRPVIPIDDLLRMVVAVGEGSAVQSLTELAAHGLAPRRGIAQRAITALLLHFSVTTGSVSPPG